MRHGSWVPPRVPMIAQEFDVRTVCLSPSGSHQWTFKQRSYQGPDIKVNIGPLVSIGLLVAPFIRHTFREIG